MSSGTCINCGSHAINHHMHGRDGTYSDFCNVCFWRARADSMQVIIDGVEYVPKAEVLELNDKRLQGVLEVLTEMRYFNQSHKMFGLAYSAIKILSPALAELEPDVAFDLIHGNDD